MLRFWLNHIYERRITKGYTPMELIELLLVLLNSKQLTTNLMDYRKTVNEKHNY
ncbi:hypothetical protein DESC_790027 [Desulfosarcina cetonica]|nr:hypothetical protein DESC_790027 [Desulfosarcina cetonica]